MSERTVETPSGPARVLLDTGEAAAGNRGLLVLGHGAGGGVDAPDLLAVREVALARGLAVARVLQPYRVAGRRGTPPPGALDAAWAAVLDALCGCDDPAPGRPRLHGGRSSGARVACRVAADPAREPPAGVLALAFPQHAPARRDGTRADRGPELDAPTAAGIPVLVVQGDRDRFGVPDPAGGREVVTVAGDHGLRARRGVDAAAVAADAWFARVLGRHPTTVPRF